MATVLWIVIYVYTLLYINKTCQRKRAPEREVWRDWTQPANGVVMFARGVLTLNDDEHPYDHYHQDPHAEPLCVRDNVRI